jgi:codanin-1
MPARISKTVSRSGRFRHITTKFSGDSAIAGKAKLGSVKGRLLEAFLQAQSLSVRKTVEFAIERVFSAVVKDFQRQSLLKQRNETKLLVDRLEANEAEAELLCKKLYSIYNDALRELHVMWDKSVGRNARKRAEMLFESLMPEEMLKEVKGTLVELTVERILGRLADWKVANISSIGEY